MPIPLSFAGITSEWQEEVLSHKEENRKDTLKYYADDPNTLATTSLPHTFTTGTGSQIFSSILPSLETARSEIIFITCFWARSSSLTKFSSTLRALSASSQNRGGPKLRVRIGFSSISLFQKLFQPHTTAGTSYPPSTWVKKLSLPDPTELQGLDLEIKSIFLLPFSVMHPKFVIVDRKTVFLPSCNVSWEEWFEGCIELSGPVVSQFVRFWEAFWSSEFSSTLPSLPSTDTQAHLSPVSTRGISARVLGPTHSTNALPVPSSPNGIPTLFLPSPHHLNPRFRPFTSSPPTAPPTPLNTLLLTLLNRATSSIYIQTPNLTSPPVLSALLRALRRGTNVHVRTSDKLMILEQLVTAGTTTVRCVKKLVRRHKRLIQESTTASVFDEEALIDLPRDMRQAGTLRIEFFEPRGGFKTSGEEAGEPQQSHLKLLIADSFVTVLGSGNLDRASWFTSQELGVAFFDKELAVTVRESVDAQMEGRVRVFYAG